MYTYFKNIGQENIQIYREPEKVNLITEMKPGESAVLEAHKAHDVMLFSSGKTRVTHSSNSVNRWTESKVIQLD